MKLRGECVMSRRSCLIIDEPYISKIIAQKKTWELRRKPTKKREVIALGKKGTSKAIGTAEIVKCFQMAVDALCQEKYKDKHCSTPASIREYAWGKDKQKHLGSLWVYVLKDAKAIKPTKYSDTRGSWCFVELEENK